MNPACKAIDEGWNAWIRSIAKNGVKAQSTTDRGKKFGLAMRNFMRDNIDTAAVTILLNHCHCQFIPKAREWVKEKDQNNNEFGPSKTTLWISMIDSKSEWCQQWSNVVYLCK
jgi:hypothetical protein